MKKTPIIMIAAINKLGFIGNEGDLIVKSKRDLQRFKDLSSNGVLVMGRKTFESLPKALPNRSVVVLTSGKSEIKYPAGYDDSDVLIVGDASRLLEAATRMAERKGRDKIVLAGGSSIYGGLIHEAEKLYLTEFNEDSLGDARFPMEALNQLIADKRLVQTNQYDFYDDGVGVSFIDYEMASTVVSVDSGDYVTLVNGYRFYASQVIAVLPSKDSVVIMFPGAAIEIHEVDMNIERFLQDLDSLMRDVALDQTPLGHGLGRPAFAGLQLVRTED